MKTNEIINAINLLDMERNNFEIKNYELKVALYRIMTNNHAEPIPPDVVARIHNSWLDIQDVRPRMFNSGNHIPVSAYRLMSGTDMLAKMEVKS